MNVLATIFINIATTTAQVLLAPINSYIFNNFPSLNDALTSIASLFNLISTYLNYIVDALGIPQVALDVIIFYYGFILTVPLSIYVIKIAIKWYHYLMP